MPNSADTLIGMLEQLATGNPKMQAKLDEIKAKLKQHRDAEDERMDRAHQKIKEAVDELVADGSGFRETDLLYALCSNLVLVAYIYQMGDRAKARDYLAGAIDACMEDTDEQARHNGLYDTMRSHEKALATGDSATIKRSLAEIAAKRFWF